VEVPHSDNKTMRLFVILAICLGTICAAMVRPMAAVVGEDLDFKEGQSDTDESDQRRLWNVMLFGGALNSGSLEDVLLFKTGYEDAGFVGLAFGREVYSNEWFSIEVEGGVGLLAGDSHGSQIWGAGYARWNRFPWNNIVKTSIAASIGINYSFRDIDFEQRTAAPGKSKQLLHYFSPEITFALPEFQHTELVVRIHHRSSVYGLFDCRRCGSNTPTIGLRHRF